MASIIIQSDSLENLKLISQLAKKLGDKVNKLTDTDAEDFELGSLMDKIKTSENVSRETIMQKLKA